ncbi:MAG: glycine--tRNA ligase subunit beta [Pseudomonadota bacterium]
MADLLVELFSEEIPARMQAPAAAALARAVNDGLSARGMGVPDTAWTTFHGPRRIGLSVTGISGEEPRRSVRRRGPRVDAPRPAQEGFRRSLDGLAHRIEEVDEKKGRFLVAVVEEGGTTAATVVRAVLEEYLPRFPWPKSMRWSAGEARWVRPLQRILCLLDGAAVEVRFAGLVGGAVTSGHRFMAPEPFAVAGADDHRDRLRAAKVLIDPAERRARIVDGAKALAAAHGLSVRDDPGLVDELVGLAEWPVPLIGTIDGAFMCLPVEVLTTSMRAHQRYLALDDDRGALAARFVVVANLEADDGGAAIIAGNERVLRARLWDARYFWDSDRATALADREGDLERMVFHTKLGSMALKAQRLEPLASWLADRLGLGVAADAARAGRLAKADLVTGMVGEFPELQGVMGAYYAREQGEAAAVADAIGQHYAPEGPSDRVPTAPAAVAVALADKLDSLVGLYAAGERATGSKDPLGLRRLALGIVRLLFENGLRLPLRDAFGAAFDGYGTLDATIRDTVVDELVAFVADRLKVHLRDEGLSAELLAAVFAVGNDDDLLRVREKARAVARFLASEDGIDLLAAHRRAMNIVRIETRKDGRPVDGEVDTALLVDAIEQDLATNLSVAADRIRSALETEEFAEAMASLASLRGPLDRFFEGVLVNVDDAAIRANRLRLLSRLGGLLDGIAAFDMLDEPRAAA